MERKAKGGKRGRESRRVGREGVERKGRREGLRHGCSGNGRP